MAYQIRRNRGMSLPRYGVFVPHGNWRKMAWIRDEWHPDGIYADVTPAPGHCFVRATYPPRGRGRGESLYSDRRINAKLRAVRAVRLRMAGHTWKAIARMLGFRDPSGPWRAVNRAFSALYHEERRREDARRRRSCR